MTAAQTSTSLLALAVSSILLPAAFAVVAPPLDNGVESEMMLDFSRGTAIVLLVIYILYLIFQLRTHTHLFQDDAESEEEAASLTMPIAIGLLVLDTLLVSVSAEFLVGSIEGLAEKWNLSQTFVGLILLPIVGNAAEHVSAVTSAMKNKMELGIYPVTYYV